MALRGCRPAKLTGFSTWPSTSRRRGIEAGCTGCRQKELGSSLPPALTFARPCLTGSSTTVPVKLLRTSPYTTTIRPWAEGGPLLSAAPCRISSPRECSGRPSSGRAQLDRGARRSPRKRQLARLHPRKRHCRWEQSTPARRAWPLLPSNRFDKGFGWACHSHGQAGLPNLGGSAALTARAAPPCRRTQQRPSVQQGVKQRLRQVRQEGEAAQHLAHAGGAPHRAADLQLPRPPLHRLLPGGSAGPNSRTRGWSGSGQARVRHAEVW